ncbi:MAG: OadG family protein [Acutalibacteraceae bacterium]
MQLFQLAAAMDGSKVLGISSSLFVCLMGVGIVFAGLVCIVLICKLMSFFAKGSEKNSESAAPVAAAPVPAAGINDTVPPEKRGEFIAAVSAAIADDLGTDVDGIRITSVKKL